MWISFNCLRPFAVKIFANGLNIISGRPHVSTPPPKKTPFMRRLSNSLQGQAQAQAQLAFQRPIPQDYVVPPKQHWIDGIVKLDGIAQQFIGENTNHPVKIKFEITPTKNKNMWIYVELANDPTVPTLRLEANAREHIRDLIDEMLAKMAIPLRKILRMSFEGDIIGPCEYSSCVFVSCADSGTVDTLDTLEASSVYASCLYSSRTNSLTERFRVIQYMSISTHKALRPVTALELESRRGSPSLGHAAAQQEDSIRHNGEESSK